jgi:hypothetical protein
MISALFYPQDMIYDMIYLLTAIGLTAGGSSTVHIYTQIIEGTQLTTLVGRLSEIRTQSGQTKINDEPHKNYRLNGKSVGCTPSV